MSYLRDLFDSETAQQKLRRYLSHVPAWRHLADLPEETCQLLLPLAQAVRGTGITGRTAVQNLHQLAALPAEQVISLAESFRKTADE